MAFEADNVAVGPGTLYFGAVGATEPTDLTTAWSSAWIPVGYTTEGHAFSYTPSYEGIEVAEELLPIKQVATGAEMVVAFAAAEMTAANVQKALNGGTITTGTGFVTFEPPAADAEPTRVAIGWEAADKSERWIWRKCLQTGGVEINRRKGTDYANLNMEFSVEVVSKAVKPFVAIMSRTGETE